MAEPTLISGAAYSRDKTGVCTVSLKYLLSVAKDATEEPWDTIHNFQPRIPLGLVENGQRGAEKQDDGDWILTVTVEGIPGGGDGSNSFPGSQDVVELDYTSQDQPIEAHPDFDKIATMYKAIFNQETRQFEGWPRYIAPPGGAAGPPAPNPIYGQTHYFDGHPYLSVTFNERAPNVSLLRNMFKIYTPRLPPGAKVLENLPAGMTWIKAGVRISFKGNVWQHSVKSMAGFWNPHIYAARK